MVSTRAELRSAQFRYAERIDAFTRHPDLETGSAHAKAQMPQKRTRRTPKAMPWKPRADCPGLICRAPSGRGGQRAVYASVFPFGTPEREANALAGSIDRRFNGLGAGPPGRCRGLVCCAPLGRGGRGDAMLGRVR